MVEMDQNTKKSPKNLKRLAVTQTPVDNYQLVWTNSQSSNNDNNNYYNDNSNP